MSDAASRILALDLGDARIGLALSDDLGITAQPVGFQTRVGPRADVEAIRKLIGRHEVARVVIGYPLLLSGRPGSRAAAAEEMASRLRAAVPNVPVELWDERLTTVQAERAMLEGNVRRKRRREVVDSLAAVLILQSYLDAHGAVERSPS